MKPGRLRKYLFFLTVCSPSLCNLFSIAVRRFFYVLLIGRAEKKRLIRYPKRTESLDPTFENLTHSVAPAGREPQPVITQPRASPPDFDRVPHSPPRTKKTNRPCRTPPAAAALVEISASAQVAGARRPETRRCRAAYRLEPSLKAATTAGEARRAGLLARQATGLVPRPHLASLQAFSPHGPT